MNDLRMTEERLRNVLGGDYNQRLGGVETKEDTALLLETLNTVLDKLDEKKKDSERSNAIISGAPVPMLIFDDNFNIVDANPAFFSSSGYARDYIIGSNAASFNVSEIEGDSYLHVAEMNKSSSARMRAEIPNGKRIIERHLVPFLDDGGRKAGYFGFYFDITESERRKGELEKLAKLSDYYDKNFPEVITAVDAISSGNPDYSLNRPEFNEDFPEASGYLNDLYSGLENIQKTNAAIPEISDMLARVAVNDYTHKLTGDYTGGLKEIVDYANMMVDHMLVIQETVDQIAFGDLSKLEVYKKIGRRSENDKLVPAFIALMENLNEIVDEAVYLSDAVKSGNLSAKANMEKFHGEYQKIVRSFVELAKELLKPLNEARRMADRLAGGDYTTRFDESLIVHGDLLEFKNELNAIAISGTEMIKNIKSVSSNVNSSASEVSIGAGEISKAVEQVALNSQKAATLVTGLLTEIEGIAKQIVEFSAANEEITGASQEILERAKGVVQTGRDAQLLGKNTTDSMSAVKDITKRSVEEIDELNVQMQEINNIVKLITDITNQINLLALNAAIEAARAGEHGRGFAVVAGEVKNLAVEARNATNHIEDVIEKVKKSSQNTAAAITSANNEVNNSVVDVEKTIHALNEIVGGTEAATDAIGEITKTLEDQANIATNIVHSTEAGKDLTVQVQSRSEELASLAEEASSSTEEITSAIHEVSLMTKELEDSTNVFKIEG